MDKLEFKKKLIRVCLTIQNKSVENLTSVMRDAQQSANDYGQPKDRYDSYRVQLLRKCDMFGSQLKKVYDEIKVLEKIEVSRTNNTVSFGAVVITDAQKIFVSIGIGKIDFQGEAFYAISTLVPFYKAMVGLKQGDVFDFRGKDITILELF
ncbi:MAG: hypothetical protein K8S00_12915 [Bacteroidales bacterium]|nr:hypothetical protein [Bacteroidales bacterium]